MFSVDVMWAPSIAFNTVSEDSADAAVAGYPPLVTNW